MGEPEDRAPDFSPRGVSRVAPMVLIAGTLDRGSQIQRGIGKERSGYQMEGGGEKLTRSLTLPLPRR